MVVIGDVTGRGAKAAAVTAHARYTLRTAAALTGDPVIALRTLNRELLARQGTALCSVAAMAVSEDPSQPVRLAVAGHPPPLLVDGDSVTEAGATRARSSGPSPTRPGAWRRPRWPRASSWSSSPTGSPRRPGEDGRFGEERLRGPAGRGQQPGDRRPADRGRPARVRRRHARRRRRDRRHRPGHRRSRVGIRARSGSWSSVSSRPSTAAIPRRSSPSATRGWSFFPVGTAEQLGRDRPLRRPRGPAASTCATSSAPGTSC